MRVLLFIIILFLANNTFSSPPLGELEGALYGTAVYQARVLLFQLTRKSYMSDCEKIAPVPSAKKVGQFATT
jgi:hypothetical protein